MRVLVLLILFTLFIPIHAQDDPCTRETVLSTFAEATDMVVWSQQFSACPGQMRRAVSTLAAGFQLLNSEFLPFAAADNPTTFSPIWKWYQGSSGSGVHTIDPVTNILTLIADSMTQQQNEITTAPVLAYPTNGDVTAQVKLTFEPLDDLNGAALGIRAAQDPTNWVRIARVGNAVEVSSNTLEGSVVVASVDFQGESDVYLKVERTDVLFTLSYSVNGDDWEIVAEDYKFEFPAEIEVYLTTYWPVERGAALAFFSEMKVEEF